MLAAVPALNRGPDGPRRAALLLGFLRSGERIGSMLGPMIAATLVASAGPPLARRATRASRSRRVDMPVRS
jgi:hypothetical protein